MCEGIGLLWLLTYIRLKAKAESTTILSHLYRIVCHFTFLLFISLSSRLSYSLGLCLKAVDQREREKKIYILREKLWRINVWNRPSSQCCESRWKWVKMPNNFKGFQTWGCLLNGDRTCGFIILFYVNIMPTLWRYVGRPVFAQPMK